ncbi:MAG: zf-HC2 domain-containing protein [Planctomycetota bacterium]
MRCDDIRLQLSALVRGDLGPAEAARAREHAAGCEACGRAMKELEAVEAALGNWQADPGQVDVWPAVSARLPRTRWSPMRLSLAAAVLLAAVGVVFHVAGPRPKTDPVAVPPGPEVMAATNPETRAVARHAEIAGLAGRRADICYAYIGEYDEALNAGDYARFSDKAAASAAAKPEVEAAGLLVPPSYVPHGSTLRRIEPAIATAEAAWSTPFGEVTVMQEKGGKAREVTQTVVGGGREVKLTRFASGDVQVTVVAEGLPWPEVDRIEEGFRRK